MAESGGSQTKDKTSGIAWGDLANTNLFLLVLERKVSRGTGRGEARPRLVQLGTICQHEESRRLTHQRELELVQESSHWEKPLLGRQPTAASHPVGRTRSRATRTRMPVRR